MRCACPFCGDFMPQAISRAECVCPACGYTCAACIGGSTPMSLEEIMKLNLTQSESLNDSPNEKA